MHKSIFEIRSAVLSDIPEIQKLICLTVEKCYPAIYSSRIVDFFLEHHSSEEIEKRFTEGYVAVLLEKNTIKGTGFIHGEQLGGVYICPGCQRKGYGSAIVEHLMDYSRRRKISRIWLHSTPMAKPMYHRFGFQIIGTRVDYIDDQPLEYFRMEYNLV